MGMSKNGEQNLQLIREIEANRSFLLSVLAQNPTLLARAEPRIRQLLEPLPPLEGLAWLEAVVWPTLNDDSRTPDQIVGYDEHGLPG